MKWLAGSWLGRQECFSTVDCSLAGLNCIYTALSISIFKEEKAKKRAMPNFGGGWCFLCFSVRVIFMEMLA